MQTKILYSVFLFLISAAVSAQTTLAEPRTMTEASPMPELSFNAKVIPDKTEPAFRLYVYNPEKKRIDLKISHYKNGEVVDTSFKDAQFVCRYNLGQAEDGRYIVVLVSGKEKITRTVDISTVTKRNVILVN